MASCGNRRVVASGVEVSRFSYVSPDGRLAYLEEDCDACAWLAAAGIRRATAGKWRIRRVKRARCREYPSFAVIDLFRSARRWATGSHLMTARWSIRRFARDAPSATGTSEDNLQCLDDGLAMCQVRFGLRKRESCTACAQPIAGVGYAVTTLTEIS